MPFPGQYFDAETGLHYNYFRTYDPSTGRYLRSDLIGLAGGISTYSYVGSNPLRHIDALGLEALVRGFGAEAPGGRLSFFLAATFANINYTYTFGEGLSIEQLLVPEIGVTFFGFCEEPINPRISSGCGTKNQSTSLGQDPEGNLSILFKNFGFTFLGQDGQCVNLGAGVSFPVNATVQK